MNFLVAPALVPVPQLPLGALMDDVKLVCALPPLTAARYPPRWLVPVLNGRVHKVMVRSILLAGAVADNLQ